MASTSASSARRGRRLLAAFLGVLSLAAAAATLMTPPTRAADQQGNPAAPPRASTRPTDLLTPTATPITCDGFTFDPSCASPSPSPTVIVVSPVPEIPSPSPTTPSYLQGTDPSPTAKVGDTTSSPVPLGGGFVDQLPSPSTLPAGPAGALTPHQSGLPLPFLAVGAVLILGALGSLIYAIAPRDRRLFTPAAQRPPASPVLFTPYGPDAPGTNILSPGQSPRPRPRQGP